MFPSTSEHRRYLGSCSEAQLDKDIRGALSFEECPDVLRASQLGDILSRFGKVLGFSQGSEDTYNMSRAVPSIDAFLSHNWVVTRSSKAIALSMHFFWDYASCITLAVMIFMGVLSAFGFLPILSSRPEYSGFKGPQWRFGIMCEVVAPPVFFLVMFLAGDFASICKLATPSVFLDKTCIHQTDPEVQRRGIERLGAFLYKSDKLIALYTDTYLEKVWTTFEVGSFVALHGPSQLVVVPISHAILMLVAISIAGVNPVIASISYEIVRGKRNRFIHWVNIVAGGFYAIWLRRWAKRKDAVINRLKSVRVQDCVCAVEADRNVVYNNIAMLMRASIVGRRSMSQEEAVEAFNARLSADLSGAFETAFGLTNFQYRHYVVAAFFMSGGKAIDFWASLSLGNSVRNVAVEDLYLFTWVFGFWIILFVFLEKIVACFLNLAGWKQALWVLFSNASTGILTYAFEVLGQAIRSRAETSDFWLAAEVALLLTMSCLAAWAVVGEPRPSMATTSAVCSIVFHIYFEKGRLPQSERVDDDNNIDRHTALDFLEPQNQSALWRNGNMLRKLHVPGRHGSLRLCPDYSHGHRGDER
mmetsp:Transcript_92203/g.192794  ORF Transcript_92203/g.192794 Transcript_92203/m.192794 type:complete len:586 (+) Transcript_92203:255-2012(+)